MVTGNLRGELFQVSSVTHAFLAGTNARDKKCAVLRRERGGRLSAGGLLAVAFDTGRGYSRGVPLSLEPPYSQLRKIGRAVAARRRELKISQEDFAETCDLHRTHMGEIERGEVNLSWQSLARVARGLKLKPSALLLRAGL